MKASLSSALALTLGLFVTQVRADEIEWRATRPKAEILPTTSTAPVQLGLPGDLDRAVTLGIVRAKHGPEDPRPLPIGPTLKGDKSARDAKTEFFPRMPTPVPPPTFPGGPTPLSEPMFGGGHSMHVPDGAYCDSCCDPCYGPIRCCLRDCVARIRHRVSCWGDSFFGDDGCCEPCCPERPRRWINASYLLWTVSGQDAPPLVAVNPGDIPVIGVPGTSVVLGGEGIENDWRSGGRIQFGFWLPRRDWLGVDFSVFYLTQTSEDFFLSSPGVPQVGRPFINADNNLPFSELVAGVGVSGNIRVEHDFALWGFDTHVRGKGRCGPRGWADWFVGYRYLNMDERLTITENVTASVPGGPATNFIVQDRFGTQNIFNGLDLGIQAERRLGRRFFVQGTARIALGYIHQIVDISGSTTRTIGAGPPETLPSGFAALPSNTGNFTRNRFGVVPELGLKVGLDITQRLRIYAGYDFLWINNVVRPAEQYDPVINLGQIPFRGLPNTGQPRPAVLFRDTTFWAQGVNFGLEYRY